MTLICLTLTLSISLFLLTPFLVEWAQGFLDKRVVYDIQIDSDYTAAENVKLLPETDYAFLDSFFEEKRITLKDDCTFSTYFLKASDVHGQSAITAISLSDYNHLMEMFGYEEILSLIHISMTVAIFFIAGSSFPTIFLLLPEVGLCFYCLLYTSRCV